MNRRGNGAALVPVVAPVPAVAPVEPAPDTPTGRAPVWVLSILVIGFLTYVALFFGAILGTDSELLQALTISPILIGLTVPLALRIARTDRDPTLAGIVMAGLVLKMLGALVRWYVSYKIYGPSRTDAEQYHLTGAFLAPQYRRLDFATSVSITGAAGTKFTKELTGVVYAIFGTSHIGGFIVFAWLSFLGLLLIARVFKIGVPEGNARRYLIAVLFLPGLVYWPAAIGKEGWMMLAIGLCAFGIACLFQGRTTGLVPLVAGVAAMLAVRPHIALIIFVGVTFALLVRRAPARTYAAPLFRILGLAVLVVVGLFLVSRTTTFLHEADVATDSVTGVLDQAQAKTADGGSQFTPIRVNNPIDMVPAFVTVFFRPFPVEAHSGQELATSAECILLFGLLVASRKRIRSLPRLMRTTPYVAFCVGYVLAFVFAFASFANFGILARQRVQAVPFLLILIALPRFADLDQAPVEAPAIQVVPQPRPPGGRRRSRRPPPATPDLATPDLTTPQPAAPEPATLAPSAARDPALTTRSPVSSGVVFAPPPRPGPSPPR